MKSVAVFCGSSSGSSPGYADLARSLGAEIAASGKALVYGGGNVGLMGIVADAALEANGRVIGVMTRALMDKELGHSGLMDLRITETMHQRKAMMEREAGGFIALPGGFGTLDEIFEIITWGQLGIHRKPVGILDTADGFFRHLVEFMDDLVANGFVRPEHREMIHIDTDPARLLQRMDAWQPMFDEKWLDRDQLAPRR